MEFKIKFPTFWHILEMPRILKEPDGCRFSSFRKTSWPTSSEIDKLRMTGVLMKSSLSCVMFSVSCVVLNWHPCSEPHSSVILIFQLLWNLKFISNDFEMLFVFLNLIYINIHTPMNLWTNHWLVSIFNMCVCPHINTSIYDIHI